MRAPLNQSTGKQKTNTLERHLKRMAGAGAPKHTIVLLQETASKSTRTFSDFESVADAMNGICQLYEQRLKQMNPGTLPHLPPATRPSHFRPANCTPAPCGAGASACARSRAWFPASWLQHTVRPDSVRGGC